jgi:hypothetical protein
VDFSWLSCKSLRDVTLRYGGLDVVAAEELLEVQDRERVTLVERKELAEGGVGLDRLLVHEVVGAGIRHDALRDRRAADLRVLRVGKEAAELVADLDGLREDAGLRLRTLNRLRLTLAAAVGLLDHAGRLLLNDLEGTGGGRGRRLESTQLLVELRDRLLERGTDILLNDRVRGSRGHDIRRKRCRGHNGRLNNGGGGLRSLCLGGLHWDRCSNGNSGGLNNGRNLRLRRLRGLGRNGAHFGSIGGTICGHLTRVLDAGWRHTGVNFGRQTIKVAASRALVARLSY